jgi:ATP-dependent Lhr-like helicase
VPTHSLELLEGAALKQAIKNGVFESRDPMLLTMDVLIQYMVTLAVSDGFRADELFREVKPPLLLPICAAMNLTSCLIL